MVTEKISVRPRHGDCSGPLSLHRELKLLAGNLQEAMVDALGVCIIARNCP